MLIQITALLVPVLALLFCYRYFFIFDHSLVTKYFDFIACIAFALATLVFFIIAPKEPRLDLICYVIYVASLTLTCFFIGWYRLYHRTRQVYALGKQQEQQAIHALIFLSLASMMLLLYYHFMLA